MFDRVFRRPFPRTSRTSPGHLDSMSEMSIVDTPFRPSSSSASPDLDRVRCLDLCSFAQESVVETMGCSDQKVENLHKDFDFSTMMLPYPNHGIADLISHLKWIVSDGWLKGVDVLCLFAFGFLRN